MAKLGNQWTSVNVELMQSLQHLRAQHFSEPRVSISDVSAFLFEHVMVAFDWLALAAVIVNQGQKFFACHGGLSPQLTRVTDIQQLKVTLVPNCGNNLTSRDSGVKSLPKKERYVTCKCCGGIYLA